MAIILSLCDEGIEIAHFKVKIKTGIEPDWDVELTKRWEKKVPVEWLTPTTQKGFGACNLLFAMGLIALDNVETKSRGVKVEYLRRQVEGKALHPINQSRNQGEVFSEIL